VKIKKNVQFLYSELEPICFHQPPQMKCRLTCLSTGSSGWLHLHIGKSDHNHHSIVHLDDGNNPGTYRML